MGNSENNKFQIGLLESLNQMENCINDLPLETTLSNYLRIPSSKGGVEVNVLKTIEVLNEK